MEKVSKCNNCHRHNPMVHQHPVLRGALAMADVRSTHLNNRHLHRTFLGRTQRRKKQKNTKRR